MYSLLEDSTGDLRSQKFKKLTKAVCGLVSFGGDFFRSSLMAPQVSVQGQLVSNRVGNTVQFCSLQKAGGWRRTWLVSSDPLTTQSCLSFTLHHFRWLWNWNRYQWNHFWLPSNQLCASGLEVKKINIGVRLGYQPLRPLQTPVGCYSQWKKIMKGIWGEKQLKHDFSSACLFIVLSSLSSILILLSWLIIS